MTIIGHTNQFINLKGLDNHEVRELEIVSCASVTESHKGPVVLIFISMPAMAKEKTFIHLDNLSTMETRLIKSSGR